MGKNKKGGDGGKGGGGGGKGDQRSRDKVDHRAGGKGNRRGADNKDAASDVPQELIDRAAMLGCEIWEVD